jgi:predicted DNA-binding transcriptional regulator AlpA
VEARARRDPDELLTPNDLLKVLKVSRATLKRLLAEGTEGVDYPAVSLYIRSLPRWRWAEVRDWIRAAKFRPKPSPKSKGGKTQ